MTPQKSFTTEIEWFDPENILPDKNKLILFIENNSDCIHFGYWTSKNDTVLHFMDCRNEFLVYYMGHIKYWAYCPAFEE